MHEPHFDRLALRENIKTHFPAAIGILLTGSSRKREQLNIRGSDIDVVILDMFYSDITSKVFPVNGILVDCTIIPVFDLQNVIDNGLIRDPKRILLTMITEGVILFDTDTIAGEIQNSLRSLLLTANEAAAEKYSSLLFVSAVCYP